MSIREKLFGRPERDALMRVLREQEQRIAALESTATSLVTVSDTWESRYFEQRRQYDELVFSQRKLIHEGLREYGVTK